mmetsp:Transcript_148235/g.476116  ORF Transcript_148235/g.476116 Transcript_148235/m.476116 type:complete len:221 (+) Transcript_148235:409-1071(+)
MLQGSKHGQHRGRGVRGARDRGSDVPHLDVDGLHRRPGQPRLGEHQSALPPHVCQGPRDDAAHGPAAAAADAAVGQEAPRDRAMQNLLQSIGRPYHAPRVSTRFDADGTPTQQPQAATLPQLDQALGLGVQFGRPHHVCFAAAHTCAAGLAGQQEGFQQGHVLVEAAEEEALDVLRRPRRAAQDRGQRHGGDLRRARRQRRGAGRRAPGGRHRKTHQKGQ